MMGGRGGAPRTNLATAVAQAAARAQAPTAGGDIGTQIRSIYDSLSPGPGDWVNIADIRERLSGFSRDEVDAALRDLEQRRDVNIVPQADERNLKQRTRDAGIVIGGQVKHFIAMGI